uniref:Type I polyketide synthase n=1 Tax=Gambierdiscus excentricus TaxID=986170 RepID=A0A1S6K7V4_9DINO|nr:type I polyketide synthase [Gambierdiscus excentricus]
MPSKLKAGQLVEIGESKEAFETPLEWRKAGSDGIVQVSGEKGQVTEYDEETGKWMVATFGATMVTVAEDLLRPLTADDVKDFDLVLGPASNAEIMGQELTEHLARKGHVLCKLFVAPEDLVSMVATADRCVEEGAFARLATELEPGYLGKHGTGKTLSIDMDGEDTADFVKESPLKMVEDAISSVGLLLRPFCEGELGFDVYSRSNSMLALPFDGDEDSYVPPDLENEDAASFLSMMWRAKLQVVVNAGPGIAKMTMLPKLAGDAEVPLTVQPGMLAIVATDRYRFQYEPQGKALMIASWFLDEPKEYTISDVSGDLSYVTGSSGPQLPNVRQVPVVSLSDRYAFGVDEPWKLWTGYAKAGWDTQTRHPFQRWDCDIYYEPDADVTSGKSYTCHGGFSDGIELFDCRFFDISPAEAKGMDPTQRQVLEVSYVALQGAGWTKKQLQMKPANIAAFVGLDKNEWNSIPKDIAGGFGASSSANAITSNRFNYCMNLKGASMTIDTACSASLVCTHTGKLYLLHDEYDAVEAVIVCGVNLSMSPFTYIGGCGAGMHSHLGRCFTYNFSADGYARGEATAAIAIKQKPYDKEGGDFALMAGSQVNQDGRSASLTAPNGPSQERCNRAVLKEVKCKPREVDTTECHGTGTSLGDPIEIGAYRKVMAEDPRSEPVTITSSKSNLGHCEGSAGVSGFTKCVLLCMYGEGTPNCHLNCLNPHLDMDGFPGIITSEGLTFKAEHSYNGVLSFGFGGTNACALCWGPNVMTSRAITTKDVYAQIMDKIMNAPAQEVTITGDDWDEWEMGGPERDAKPGDQWDIEIDEDGVVEYTKKEKEVPELGDAYFVTGTFNEWGYDAMDPDGSLAGLHAFTIEIGDTGSEEFQVNADQDPAMTFYPDTIQCTMRSAPVKGPGFIARENAWLVKGEPGDKFRVEFYTSEAGMVSISWIKES